jgi:N-acetylmuramoyl-L-alanine amidase
LSKRKWLPFLLLLFMLMPKLVCAAAAPSSEISAVRFALHTDRQTGAKWLRIVLDVTGPVQANDSLDLVANTHLTVSLCGTGMGKVDREIALDGSIANDMNISAIDANNSKVVINLPAWIGDSDYLVSVLPGDVATQKPYRVVIDIHPPVLPATFHFTPGLRGKVIAIDPGHGGTDSGAIGPDGIEEKNVTLAVALKVRQLLEQAGAKVVMSRTDDRDVYAPYDSAVDELSARAMVGNRNHADVFLDIHANSFPNRRVGGTATYYYNKTGYDMLLAQCLQDNAVAADGLNDRGVHSARFYVLKHTIMPAALIEMAFISNPVEEHLLNTPSFQQQMAQGIVNGLDKFFGQAAKLGEAN